MLTHPRILLCSALLAAFALVAPARAALTAADEALLDRDYDRAASLYQADADKGGEGLDRALVGLGTALRLKGDHEKAIAAFERLAREKASPASRARAAFRRAESLGALGRFDEAAEAWQKEADRLLSPMRKEELASGYLALADKAMAPAEGAQQQPGGPPPPPRDPQRAAHAYGKALEIGLPADRARTVRLSRAQAQLAAGQADAARTELVALEKELPKDAREADELALTLARAFSRAGDTMRARRRYRELAERASGDLGAEALLELARSYGLPVKTSDAELQRGTEALRELAAKFAKSRHALDGQLLLASTYVAAGRHDDAQAALKGLIDAAKDGTSDHLARARVMLARSLRAQKRFDEALAAFSAYLSAHPFHEASVSAQHEVMDTQAAVAWDLADRKKPVEAAQAFEAFLVRYPLDSRGSKILLKLAELEQAKEDPKRAIEAYRRVVTKYPGTGDAARAQFEIGSLFETALADPKAALEEYGKLNWGDEFRARAQQRKATLESRELTITPQRVFRASEAPELTVRTRNLKALTVKVYRVDPAAYFARMRGLAGLDGLDIDLINPDHTFEHPIADAKDFVLVESKVALPVKGPGLWVVQAGEEELWASIGVLVSDLELVVKAARGHLFAMTWDGASGKPLPGVELVVSDGARQIARKGTDEHGVLVLDGPELAGAEKLSVLALHPSGAAATYLAPGAATASSLAPRGYVYTDRPAYRPGQTVHVKAVVREVKDGAYAFTAGDETPVSVAYPSGRALHDTKLALSGMGTLAFDVALPAGAPDGDYAVRVGHPRKQLSSGAFRVAAYQTPAMVVKIEPAATVLAENEPLKGKIRVVRPDGSPVRDAALTWKVDAIEETFSAITDARGEAAFDIDTRDLTEAGHSLRAWVAQEGVSTEITFQVAGVGVKPKLAIDRDVLLSGETVTARFWVTDVLGKPVKGAVKLEAARIVSGSDEAIEKSVDAATDEKGEGTASLQPVRGGRYTLRLWASDAGGHRASAATALTVTAPDDPVRVRILTESDTVRAGETATVRVISWARDGQALLTIEAGRVLHHEVIALKTGENAVPVAMRQAYAPNITLGVMLLDGTQLHAASRELTVRHGLALAVAPDREGHAPGDEVEVKLSATDHLGRPVDAEVSVAVVDEALLSLFPDTTGPITETFQQRREHTALSTASSAGTTYAAVARTLSEELLAEESKGRRVTMKHDTPVPLGRVLREIGSRGGFRVVFPQDLEQRMAAVDLNDVAAEEALHGVLGQHGLRAVKKMVAGRAVFTIEMPSLPVLAAAPPPPPAPGEPAGEELAEPSVELEGKEVGAIEEAAKDVAADLDDTGGGEGAGGGAGGGAPAQALSMRVNAPKPAPRSGLARMKKEMMRAMRAKGERAHRESDSVLDKAAAESSSEADERAPTVRDFFPETAFWTAAARTGAGGSTTVKFTLPSSLTRYRILARAVTAASQVGEAAANVVAARALSAELLVPPYMVQGDEAGLIALVRGRFEKPTPVALVLDAHGTTHEATVELQPGAEARVPFRIAPPAAEQCTLMLTAKAAGDGDAVRRVVPVLPRGALHYDSAAGLITESAMWELKLPRHDLTGRKLVLPLSPGLPGVLVDALAGEASGPGATSVDAARRELACFEAAKMLPGLADREERRARVQALLGQIAGEPATQQALDAALKLEVFAGARRAGLVVADDQYAEAMNATRNFYGAASDADKLWLLFAQAGAGAADFSLVNRFLRGPHGANRRTALLVATLARMGRREKAIELAQQLAEGGADALEPGARVAMVDEDLAETAALRLFALLAARPDATGVKRELDLLLALRGPYGWASSRAAAAACQSIAAYLTRHAPEAANFRLKVRVGDGEELTLSSDELKSARALSFGEDRVPASGHVSVHLHLEGRGAVDARAVLSGFEAGRVTPQSDVMRVNRNYARAPLVHRGKEVPRGSGCVAGSYTWPQNPLTQLSPGQAVEVSVSAWTPEGSGRVREEILIEEPLPPGCSLVDKSLSGNYRHVKVAYGRILAYFSPSQGYQPSFSYRMVGRLPGRYAPLPARALSLYHPKRYAYSEGKEMRDGGPLAVLDPGQPSADAYRTTPDELFYLGKAAFGEGERDLAWQYLTELRTYTLNDDAAKEVSRILLLLAIERGDHAAVLKNFETLKEKYRDLSLPFDVVMRVGKAHREMNEQEQACYVFRGIAEASFLLEAQLPGEWEQAGNLTRAADTTRSLIAEYPDLSVVQTAHLGLAQLALERAGKSDAGLRHLGRELLEAFLVQNPDSPMADEATFALAESALDGDRPDLARTWAEAGERRYPKSRLKDAFLYTQGWALFEKGDHARALELLKPVASETFNDGQASESRPLALYLIAQIHHTRGRILEALAAYRQVADRFTDAKETADELAAREVSCPEVTRVDPGQPVRVPVTVRNVSRVEARAYRVDLMRLYLRERSLSGITRVNLSGIRPLHEAGLAAKDAAPGVRTTLTLDLPFQEEGAYLIVLKGEEASSSGLVLISRLSLAVTEDESTGRVRVHVQRQPENQPVYGASVRVVGSGSSGLSSGRTDPRGLYTAESVAGTSTVIARQGDAYAFYRGTRALASAPVQQQAAGPDLKIQVLTGLKNRARSLGQERSAYLQQRVYRNSVQGVEIQQMAQ